MGSFQGASKPITIEPWSYTFSELDIGDGRKTDKCTVAISWMKKDYGITILGDSFLREYVASFNYAEKTVSLAKSVDAPEAPPAPSGLPGGLSLMMLSLIFGLSFLCLICTIGCICCYCRARGKKNVNRASSFYEERAAEQERGE